MDPIVSIQLPEEPLEADYAYRHDREPYQGKGRFATSKAGVEEAEGRNDQYTSSNGVVYKDSPNTWNHEEN
jgi:hypothetical protein